ncbi:hypothetical protein PMAYCL1PPCAC_30147 [Pristionchus mayeri]|uniref:Transmembrane protein n=1 Tax=Pristionchus mayeri TaxID=1317129 RepID=A0AAN5IBG8_9BILA|nr:hypothetical protein PMAYCL1PPCAC_30147 [Pristionchus mayeri]
MSIAQLDFFAPPFDSSLNEVGWIHRRIDQLQPVHSESGSMEESYESEYYYASTPSTAHREPEWVTFATPICIGIAILICFAKIMCRNCTSSSERNGRDHRGDSLSSENSQQHWFVRSQQQFAQNSGIPPMIDAFFPAPPKYEDVMRAKEEESLESGSTPPRYSIPSSISSTVTNSGDESPSENDAPPDYSTMARPPTARRITVATTSIDDCRPMEVVVVRTSGRDNHAYTTDLDPAPSSSSSPITRDGARPVVLAVENLPEEGEWETARC